MELRIVRYLPDLRQEWNKFISDAKNGMFLFDRDYMEYHADRFTDHSLLFYKENELICVLPANEREGVLYSHGGLTFGGLVMSRRTSVTYINQLFPLLINYLQQQGLQRLVYKGIPFIYHTLPAQEDIYALFIAGGQLFRRDANSVIDFSQKIAYTKGTKSNLSKGRKANLQVQESSDYRLFMEIEEELLKVKYNTRPTHTAAELELLSRRFPENIKLYLTYRGDQCLGGTVLYLFDQVVHTQYIGITDEGKETGALDILTDYLLQLYRPTKKYFSFGISTEQDGRYLNEGLVRNKESFGARTIVNDFYQLALT